MRGFLARTARRFKKPPNRVLCLIDWENFLSSTTSIPAEKFSLEAGLNGLIEKVVQEIGAIVGIYVFMPPHLISGWAERLKKQGFFIICCPKIRSKTGQERDTVDEELIRLGTKLINQISKLTHLCLGSGDQDFVPLLVEAKHRGLKIALASGSIQALSTELIPFAERGPTGERRVYLLSPIEI
jgi:hypothetical protein